MIMRMVGRKILLRVFFYLTGHTKIRPGEYRYHKNQKNRNHLIRFKNILKKRDMIKRLK
jgi:hypothetical protein